MTYLDSTIDKSINIGGNKKNMADIEKNTLLNFVLNTHARTARTIPIGIVAHQNKLNRKV
ncbi:hypothetical protein PSI23_17595 [Xenorhabdus sp. XENO-10]|uniref:Uncharacterized protein n=1 Tax=Xenorhabdus yunnanensis TaxID=3025878 RepID=A0ABT5LJ66_9GAMM|nr:hypothetical protein [Xenorhabdus yunnanensis]MDC9591050.1 hypothetical protein [Xenorhabdus yunnanensis]